MATRRTPTATARLHENIGAGIRRLVAALPPTVTYEVDAMLGRQFAAMVGAAVKAAYPGRQSAKQVKLIQQEAQQAFSRSLARRVKKLDAVAPA